MPLIFSKRSRLAWLCVSLGNFLFTLQAQAIAGFSICGEATCYPEILRISYNSVYRTTFVLGKLLRHVSDKNYKLLYSVKTHVPTHTEGRKELGINGSSDLVDLGTFREDSQIDFATRNVFCTFLFFWGGGGGGGSYARTFLKF